MLYCLVEILKYVIAKMDRSKFQHYYVHYGLTYLMIRVIYMNRLQNLIYKS